MMRAESGRDSRSRRGMVVILVAVAMTLLVGVMALVLDGGLLMLERRRAQAAADAAAHAGACQFFEASGESSDPVEGVRAAALALAAANGFDDGNSTVEVNIPPANGPFAGMDGHIEVRVTAHVPRFFSGIWGRGQIDVAARAVARGSLSPYSRASILLLDPDREASLSLAGSGRTITNSTIQVNSNHARAVMATNTGFADAPEIRITGNYQTDASGYLKGQVSTGASTVSDPLTSLPDPDPSTLPTRASIPAWGTHTLQPGVYNGGMNIGGGMTVTLNPGVYYMRNGGFTIANGARVTGHGVTVYVDNGNGSISFQGGGVIDLSPPTSGPLAGVIMFQHRSNTQGINIANGTTTTIRGTIYAPASRITFAGGAQFSQYGSQVVAASMGISNNAHVGLNWRDDSVARRRTLNIVE